MPRNASGQRDSPVRLDPRDASGRRDSPVRLDPRVLINQNRRDGTWFALFEQGTGFVADADGMSRADAISWARARCDTVWIFEPDAGDFRSLEPPD